MYEIHDFFLFFFLFLFCCSYRAGVTMSLLYIDSVFSNHLRMRPYNRAARYFCQTITAKVFPHDHSGISYTKRTAMNFFPFFLYYSLYCSPLSSGKKQTFARENKEKEKKALHEQFYIHYYSFYFLLWLLHFS